MLAGASSHKAVAGEHPLLRFSYTVPFARFGVCLLNEACLLALFMLPYEAAFEAAVAAHVPLLHWLVAPLSPWLVAAGPPSLLRATVAVAFPVFALKQLFSVLQLVSAARRILDIDEARRRA